MHERPFILPTFALILGIIFSGHAHLPDAGILIFLAFLLGLLLLINKQRDIYVLPVVLASFFLIGMLNMNLYLHPIIGPAHISIYADDKAVLMEGIIVESPQFSPNKVELILAASHLIENGKAVPVEGRVMITVKGHYPFRYGDLIRSSVTLKTPRNFQNPGRFDYEKYLLYRRILVRGFVNDPDKILIIRQNQGSRFYTVVENFRASIKAVIYERAPSPQREVIQAIILGDNKEIDRQIKEKFNRVGVSHIIVISGLHVGIMAVFSLFLIRFILKISENFLLKYNMMAISTLFALIPVIMFCFIAGMGISVIRATIMAVVFMAAILIGRQRDLYNTLALAAFLILMAAPYSLFDVSFQLSFAAVFAILFIAPCLSRIVSPAWLDEKRQQYPRTAKLMFNSAMFVIVSLSATLGTWPLIIFYFNRFSNVVLPANIFVVPILGILAIPVSMAIILTAPISPTLAMPFIAISSFLVGTSIKIVTFFDSLPGASWIATTPSYMEIAAYYIFIFVAVGLLDRKDKPMAQKEKTYRLALKGVCLCMILFLAGHAVYLHLRSSQSDDLSLTAIDVGQGISTLIRLPGGKTVLIDGGGFSDGSFDVGKNIVAPYLLYERIKKIDIVVLTHPHPDHLGGLIYILENFDIGEVWTNGQYAPTPLYENFLRIMKNRNINQRVISEETGAILIDRVVFDILNPEHPHSAKSEYSEKYHLMNDQSLVLRVTFKKISFLMTGDIADHAEQRILAAGKNLKSDVLMVPHHGGFTSSTRPFLRFVQPQIAIISCGKNNVYKTPHPDVLRRLAEIRATVFRTDLHGAITIKTDGVHLFTETFCPRS
jgi:competence protein ComEC